MRNQLASLDTREIRIFISSTFMDMQEERAYLFDYIFPELRTIAEQRNVKIIEIDLRWGITYEESEKGEVLKICFEEIERCRPYFIGLLGNRYGWCPALTELEKNASTGNSYPWVKEYIEQGKSMTDMEMQFGALCAELHPGQIIKASFYVKEDSSDIGPRQKDLKRQVRCQEIYPCHSYRSVEELGDNVKRDILALLDEIYPEEESHGLQKEIFGQLTAQNNLSYDVYPKKTVIDKLDAFLDGKCRYMIVHGEKHVGKTATLAHWLATSRRMDDYMVITYFVGESDTSSMDSYERYARGYLKRIFSIDDDDPVGELPFSAFTYQLSMQRKLLFVIDGIDQFDDVYIHPSSYLPQVSKGSKIVVSARTDNCLHTDCVRIEDSTIIANEHPEILEDFEYFLEIEKGKHWGDPLLREYKPYRVRVTALSQNDIKAITSALLLKHGKKLTHRQLALLTKDPKAKYPSLLRLLLGSLLFLTTPEELDLRLRFFAETDDVDIFLRSLFQRYETLYGRELFRDCLVYLIVSRKGLPEKDLLMLLRTPQYRFSQMFFGIRPLLADKSGYFTLAHERITSVVFEHYPEIDRDTYRNHLIDYYFERNGYEEGKIDRNSWLWKFDLPYQCKAVGDYANLYEAVMTPQIALCDFTVLSWGELPIVGEIADYWRFLMEQGPTVHTPADYLENPDLYLDYADFALVYLLDVHRSLFEYKENVRMAERVLDVYEARGPKYADATLVTCLKLASMHKENGRTGPAESVLTKALDLCRRVHPSLLGNCLFAVRNTWMELFEESSDRANALDEELFFLLSGHSDDESCIRVYYEVVQSLSFRRLRDGKLTKALEMSEEMLRISEKYSDKIINGWSLMGHNIAFNHYICARVLKDIGRLNDAKDHALKASDYYGWEHNAMFDNMKQTVKSLLNEILEMEKK